MIEWVKNTQTLKSFIERAGRDIFKSKDLLERAKRLKFQEVTGQGRKDYDGKTVANMSLDKTLELQQRSCGVLPWNLLRRGLESLARSPEAFVFLQMAWTKCLASLSVATYVLGIGDRHLGNILLNTETGNLLNVDFGYSFGIQIQFLPMFPELVPFRLSPQLQNVFLPFQVSPERPSPLAFKMAACLNAWRNNASTIAAVGEVFVNDPSADWENHAKKILASKPASTPNRIDDDDDDDGNDDENASDSTQFYPRQKMEILKRKLRGVHPVAILKDEIAGRTDAYKDKWTKFAEVSRSVKFEGGGGGGGGSNDDSIPSVRDALEPTLTVNDQVMVLIDLATDPNILGRLWVGWESHV